jgi:hypothetical protein
LLFAFAVTVAFLVVIPKASAVAFVVAVALLVVIPEEPALSEVERGSAVAVVSLQTDIIAGCPIHRALCDGWDVNHPPTTEVALAVASEIELGFRGC